MKENKPFPYRDIVDLPSPRSKKHTPMPLKDRAAQFAPFAALSGYGGMVSETARMTEPLPFPAEDTVRQTDELLRLLSAQPVEQRPPVSITFFVPDGHKSGGKRQTVTDRIIGCRDGILQTAGGIDIPLSFLLEISGL